MIQKIFKKLHIIIGLVMAVLILGSAMTGFLLSRSKDLNLSEKVISSKILLSLYGPPQTYEIEGEVVAEDYPPNWEKALTALHRGRFLGRESVFVMDLLFLSLLILTFSGVYLWIKKIRLKKRALVYDRLEDLDYLQLVVEFKNLKGKENDIKDRLDELHGKIEHLFYHTDKGKNVVEAEELWALGRHIRDLDNKTHEIMRKINSQTGEDLDLR